MTFKLLQGNETQQEIVVTKEQINEFLGLIDPSLYYSIASYLIGPNSHRYFLYEYYKVVEYIENELGSEQELISRLRPYGVSKKK